MFATLSYLRAGLTLTLAAAAIASTAPAAAAGATQFVYSPVGCRTVGGALWIYPSGQISNRSVSEVMRVFCPLIHEAKAANTDDTHVSVVQANKTHRYAGKTSDVMRVRCRAFYNHPHATEDPKWVVTDWRGAEQTSLGVEKTGFTVPGHEYLGGSVMLECEIPPRDTADKSPAQAIFNGESRIGTIKSGVD